MFQQRKEQLNLVITGGVALAFFIRDAFKLSVSELSLTARFEDGLAGFPEQRLAVWWAASGTRYNIERKDAYRRNKWPALNGRGVDTVLSGLVDKYLRPNEAAVLAALPLVSSILTAGDANRTETNHRAQITALPLELVAEGIFKDMAKAPAFKDQLLTAIRKADNR